MNILRSRFVSVNPEIPVSVLISHQNDMYGSSDGACLHQAVFTVESRRGRTEGVTLPKACYSQSKTQGQRKLNIICNLF